MKLHFFVLIALINSLLISTLQAQVVVIEPENATTDDDITVYFDATEGNGALAGFTGDVYMHTGLITTESNGPGDWKYVVSDWGTPDPDVLMTPLGNDLYSLSYNIRDFYGVPEDEQVLQLAFLFRNADASIVARNADNSDIFIDINLNYSGNYLNHSVSDNQLVINSENEGALAINFYTGSMVQTAFYPDGNVEPITSFSTILEPQTIDIQLEETSNYLEFSSDQLVVSVQKSPLEVSYINSSGDTILQEKRGIYYQFEWGGAKFLLDTTQRWYGSGSRAIPTDRRGQRLEIYNQAHYGYSNGSKNLNITVPFIVSSKQLGLFFDNPVAGTLDLGATHAETLQYTVEGGTVNYYVMAGNSYNDILYQYNLLTGFQPLPPLWALGYIQSRYGYETETEARNIVNQLRSENFPLDALILDLYWFGSPATMGNLDWDYTRFPTPEDMMSDFDEIGVKTVLITEPYFTQSSDNYTYLDNNNLFATDASGSSYVLWGFWAGNSGLLDVTKDEALEWMWDFYEARIEEGVAGWWCDLGEPESHPSDMFHATGTAREIHNNYSLLWAKMLHEKYAENYPTQRLFNLIRSGYSGMQRFSTFPWSGDIQRSFDGIQAQIPIMLGMSMSGIPYMHSDLGGFTGGGMNEELYTRWMQLGAYSPVMRAHGHDVPPEPVFYPDYYKNIVREYVHERYKMLPYNYTLAWLNSTTGQPLALPMDYFEPDNSLLQNINDQYFWGENMIVAPVLQQGQTQRQVVLPSGKWIDYQTNTTYSGNTSVEIDAPLETLPVLVKAGSFIPQTTIKSSSQWYNGDTLLVKYYPDETQPESSFTLYTDDGVTPAAYANGEYELIDFQGNYSNNFLAIQLEKSGNGYAGMPYSREMIFEMLRFQQAPASVSVDGQNVLLAGSLSEFYTQSQAAFFDSENQTLWMHFNWNSTQALIEVETNGTIGTEPIEQLVDFQINKAYPNPFEQQVTIEFDALKTGNYHVDIMDLTGRVIKHFYLPVDAAGRQFVQWNGVSESGQKVPAGVYLARISNGGSQQFIRISRL